MRKNLLETKTYDGFNYVHIGGGLYVMSPVTFKDTIDGAEVKIEAEYDPHVRRIVAKQVNILATDDRPELSSSLMQKIKIQNFLRDLLKNAALVPGDAGDVFYPISLTPISEQYSESVRAQGPNESTLDLVARYYRLAEVINEPPTKAVQECLRIPRPTAANWVSRARATGLLDA
jgi:hypothetical protein